MTTDFSRRGFLVLLGGLGGCALTAGTPAPARPLYLSGVGLGDDRYAVAGFDAAGGKVFETPLPGRAHGSAVRPDRRGAVIFARRPGTFAVVVDLADGREHARLTTPANRHFNGHGAFSADGERLFTTENDFTRGRGVVGVWDVAAGYRRIGEVPSFGIGPHQTVMLADGRTLAVANGGILTHPDTGRRKLNIPTMDPNLAYLDSRTGRLLERKGFAEGRQRLLSIRHLDAGADGTVCVALQDQGARADALPLVAFHRRGEAGLHLANAPADIRRGMRAYAGSVALDAGGHVAAVSCPRGNLVTFWDVARRRFLARTTVADGCGVAPAGAPATFLITSGDGGAVLFDARAGTTRDVAAPFLHERRWDNHLVKA